MRGEWSLTKAFSLAFAVGIRPCTGAILVLILANALGIYWAGVASTLVMGIGTFLARFGHCRHCRLFQEARPAPGLCRWPGAGLARVWPSTGRRYCDRRSRHAAFPRVIGRLGGNDVMDRNRQWIGLAGFIAICLLTGALGGWVTSQSVAEWYPTLNKPA